MSLKHNIEIDFTPLREAEGRALAALTITKKINTEFDNLGRYTVKIVDSLEHLTYAQTLVLSFPKLNLTLNTTWIYFSDSPITLSYEVDSQGLTPLVPLMQKLRQDLGKPRLIKGDFELEWRYTRNGKLLTLKVSPGPNAKCEKVKVGEVPVEVSEHERMKPIYELRCEGAEDFAEVVSKDETEIEEWEESL